MAEVWQAVAVASPKAAVVLLHAGDIQGVINRIFLDSISLQYVFLVQYNEKRGPLRRMLRVGGQAGGQGWECGQIHFARGFLRCVKSVIAALRRPFA
ncbi:hypothetical protein J6590_087330 [Homalodisca vitripennis]|nr:hypothetical protein J6590_087330 [Homalodisca vitripennis]